MFSDVDTSRSELSPTIQTNYLQTLVYCTDWPGKFGNFHTAGCASNVGRRKLGETGTVYNTTTCAKLCANEQENGCCNLRSDDSCEWVPGSYSGPFGGLLAITCKTGKNQTLGQ